MSCSWRLLLIFLQPCEARRVQPGLLRRLRRALTFFWELSSLCCVYTCISPSQATAAAWAFAWAARADPPALLRSFRAPIASMSSRTGVTP